MDFRHVIAPLAARGYHVAALDMRGYGLSDKPPIQPGSATLLAVGDIDGAITALGHDTAHIVGHDTGGAMGWVYSAAYPDRVASLTSISAAHPHDLRRYMTRRPWQLMYMATRVAVGKLPVWFLRAFLPALPGIWRRELTINTVPSFHGTGDFEETLALRIQAARIDNAFRGIVHNSRLLTPKLVALTLPAAPRSSRNIDAPTHAPVLLLHPRQGVWRGIDSLAQKRAAGPVHRSTVEGTKNVPHVENPAGFVAAVAEFLRSHSRFGE